MNPRTQQLLQILEREMSDALDDAIVGQMMSSRLEPQIRRTIQSVLYRHNIRRSQINVQRQGSGFSVEITLPPQGPIVQTVVLRFS